jgi:hypothetical protein
MLRSALEARWRCARQTLRPLTDAERTFRKLTLRTRLCAGGGRSGGERAGVAGQEKKGRNRRERVEEREPSRTAESIAYRRSECEQAVAKATLYQPIDSFGKGFLGHEEIRGVIAAAFFVGATVEPRRSE